MTQAQEALTEAPPAATSQVEPAKLLEFVEAPYPEEAARAGLEARVLLRLRIDTEGRVTEAEVLEPAGHGFDEAARAAALRFRYEPTRRDGKPVRSRLKYLYEFHLPAGVAPTGTASASEDASAAPVTSTTTTTTEDGEPFEEFITVQGESTTQRRKKSAEAVRVVETEKLQREAIDMGQALARTEGAGVSRAGGLGSRVRFSLAGLTDDQIRFFIDGVPLELAGFGPDFANVPINLVQRMEIFQGVVPTRFGADALGGAVQIVTLDDVHRTGLSASYEFGSFNTHRLTLSAQKLHEPSGFFVRASGFFDSAPNTYKVNVGVPDASGQTTFHTLPRFHDAFRAGGFGVETGVVDKPWARRLLLRAFMGASTKEIQHDTSMSVPYGEVDSANGSGGATLRYEQSWEQGLSFEAVGGYVYRHARFTDEGRCTYDWFGNCVFELPQPGEIDSRAIDRHIGQHTGFARANLTWYAAPLHTLRFSLAPTVVNRTGEDRALKTRGEVDALTGDRGLTTLVGGAEYQRDALEERLENIAFVKGYLQLARTEKLLPDSTFMRVDRDTFRFGVGDSVRYRLTPVFTAKAAYEWATRFPRPDEIFGDGVLIDSNLELKPETSHNLNLELGMNTPAGSHGTFRAGVTGFARLVDQLIIPLGREGYIIYQNVYSARSLGFSSAGGWTSPGQYLTLDANITWQDFRNVSTEGTFGDFDGQRIANRPYLMGNGSARFQLGDLFRARDEASLSWNSRYTHSFYRGWSKLGREDTKQVIASQFLHSLALTYVLPTSRTTLSWTLDIQNLTNAAAYDFFGVQRPGRSISAKVVAEL